jgi:pyruvate dehydrogenase E1 component beta subunit
VREGADATLVAWGGLVPEAVAAAETLAAEGIGCEVIDPVTIKPLDEATILASVGRTGRLVIAQEAPLTCGVAAEIAARVAERGLAALRAPVQRVAGWDTVMPLPRLEQAYLPGAARIAAAVRRAMAWS